MCTSHFVFFLSSYNSDSDQRCLTTLRASRKKPLRPLRRPLQRVCCLLQFENVEKMHLCLMDCFFTNVISIIGVLQHPKQKNLRQRRLKLKNPRQRRLNLKNPSRRNSQQLQKGTRRRKKLPRAREVRNMHIFIVECIVCVHSATSIIVQMRYSMAE